MRVAVCTPCQDTVAAAFAIDLARLVKYEAERGACEVVLIQNRGTIIPQQRHTLVLAAQQAGAQHILWLDSDMRFPKDALERLLAHDKPIVAANYPTRRPPILPTAEHRDHGYLFTPDGSEGLADVTHCGMGVMLTAMRVFDELSQPWFALGFSKKDSDYLGEDFYFCTQARKAGFIVWIDQGLSLEVRHIGEAEYRAEHAIVTRDIAVERKLELVTDGA